jgi:methyl-accepting chemotaxis protein
VMQTLLLGEYAMAQEAYIGKAAPASQALMSELAAIGEKQQEDMRRELDESARSSQRAQTVILVVVVLALAGAGVFSTYMVKRVNRSLTKAASELSQSAEQITNAASQVSRASQALAQGANQQVTSLAETSTSSELINTTSEQNASNTESAARLMTETAQAVEEAGMKMESMVKSVHAIGSSSEKISRIIKVIDDIAFQTNILALNAAVEAARAGEAGMGFAVVADEVRSLAQRCAQAARDTTDLIEESITRSREGSGSVQAMVGSLETITGKTVRAKDLVETVSQASRQQAQGTREITRSISQIEQVTQQAAANAEENAAAGEQLSAQAESLRDVIADLEQLVGSRG